MNEQGKLKKQVVSGLIWTFGERILAQGVSFVLSIILARLLMPEEYGVIAIVLVFINVANVFVSNGFGEALVQKTDASEEDFSTIFYCSLLVSIVLYLVIFFIAPLVADWYDQDILTSLLRVLGLKIPLSAINTIQNAYVQRKMIFKKFFFSTIGGTLFSAVVGISMAYCGCGAWALVGQYLVNSIMSTLVLFVTVPWRPKKLFNKNSARKLVGYGWKITVSSLINTLYNELRSLLIGGVYSSSDLAYYNRGNQFPSLIIVNTDTAISKVIFPAMAKSKDDTAQLKEVCKRALTMTAYVVFPILIGLMRVAEPIVKLLLTDKWLPCVPFLQLSCIYYMFQPLQTANWQCLKAVGRSDLCVKLEVIKKIIGFSLLFASIPFGVHAIAISTTLFGFISVIINMIPNRKLISYSVFEQCKDLLPAMLLSVVMGGVVYFIGKMGMNLVLTLIIQVSVGVLTYVVLSVIFKLDSFLYMMSLIKRRW